LLQRVRFAQAAPLAIVAAAFVFSVAVNWPGHLSYDSVIQLTEGRTGGYSFWHPAVMSWLLGIFDAALPGTGLFVLFDTALVFGALALALRVPKRASWTSVFVAAFCILTPQLLLYPGIVWKDVLFTGAAALGFLLIALAADHWSNLKFRIAVIVAALLFLALAALARQNGAVVLPLAAMALGWIARKQEVRAPVLNAVLYGAGSLSAMLLVCGCAWLALETRHIGQSGPAGQVRLLQTYDLAGAVHANPGLALDRLHDDDPWLEHLMRTEAARLYTPERNDTLAGATSLQRALIRTDEATIPAQWRDVVRQHPLLYLKVRWDAFRWVLFTPDLLACRPAFAGVANAEPMLRDQGMTVRFDARDRALTSYALAYAGTPILSHATYLVVSLFCLLVLLRRRAPADIAIAGLILSAYIFTLSFFVISIACDYRYLYYLDVAALVALVYLSTDMEEFVSGCLAPVWRQTRGPSA
jgi:hypothetical protein